MYFENFCPNANKDVNALVSKPNIATGSPNACPIPENTDEIPAPTTFNFDPLLAASLIFFFPSSKNSDPIPTFPRVLDKLLKIAPVIPAVLAIFSSCCNLFSV